ncbi:MAG: DUF3784 domain-containing protein [Clostridia bacterium]|jgi:hypothetical protein|nr:DUF3784 domain-containing protein [Clostridia bacterium]
MWWYFILAVIFLLLGLAIHVFKWYFLISGYNLMSKQKKENVDTQGLGKLMGYYCYFNTIIFLLLGVAHALELKIVMTIAFILFSLSTIYVLLKAPRYDGNIYDKDGKLRPGAFKKAAIPLIMTGAILIGVAILMIYSVQPTKISISDEGLQIYGMYGALYTWDSIEDVELLESLPEIKVRTNGSAVGSHLKGHFRTTELGAVKLFVNSKISPFVYLKCKGKDVIFNLPQSEETKAAYQEIVKRLKHL